MSQAGQRTHSQQQTIEQPTIDSSQAPVATSQLIAFYDELAEMVALNSFLYDSFLSLAAESDDSFSSQASCGLGTHNISYINYISGSKSQ